MTRVALSVLPLASSPQVLRVPVAELVVHKPGIALIKVSSEGDVPCAADWVLHPFRADRPEFVSEAKVDVVEEHAYLHRKEGDESNAAYWYGRAGKPVCGEPLDSEWLSIVKALVA